MTTNETYTQLLKSLVGTSAQEVAPRKNFTRELIGYQTTIHMSAPIVTLPERKLDYQFMAAEAHWILRGSRHLDHEALDRNLNKYSDDGETMRGAYGPPFIQQVDYIVETLQKDPDSRQAVMTLWERNPRESRDIPCTVALQFLLRGGSLHLNVFMRSSDAWLGWPYDIFTFSMMAHYIRTCLDNTPEIGWLRLFAGSQHLYVKKLETAQQLIDSEVNGENLVIDIHKLIHPGDIMNALDSTSNAINPFEYMKERLCQ
jgi:thymidylate synthase